MRIGIISDTHDRLPLIDQAIDLFIAQRVDAVIHPGDLIAPFAAKRLLRWDGPLYVTYGNNDGERAGLKTVLPQIQDGPLFVELGGKTLLVHHFIDWCEGGDVEKADIIITGHTHEVVQEKRDGRLFLNPGECCGWVNDKCTVALLDPAEAHAEIIELHP